MPVAVEARKPQRALSEAPLSNTHSQLWPPLTQALRQNPCEFDFYFALRCLESAYPNTVRIGSAQHPNQEAVRFGQEPSLAFAPATLTAVKAVGKNNKPLLQMLFFGLFGPNGPMPLHLTEYARDLQRNMGEQSLVRFFDLFHHRLLSLFYRAWADAQPVVQMDRPTEDQLSRRLGSLLGIGTKATRARDPLPDTTKLHFAAFLSAHNRAPEGLLKLLQYQLQVPIVLKEYVGHWLPITPEEQLCLNDYARDKTLGVASILGERVWDCQSKFRIRCGPLTLNQFQALLPKGHLMPMLGALVHNYLGLEFDWELQLELNARDIPEAQLGVNTELGFSTWLGPAPFSENFTDLVIQPDAECI